MARKRRPLLQRTAWHALKTLMKNHPRAALSAAGAGASYAAREVAADGSEAVKEIAGSVKAALTPGHHQHHDPQPVEVLPPQRAMPAREPLQPTEEERQAFLASLTPDQLKFLARLARMSAP
jgi:hypothetical protein